MVLPAENHPAARLSRAAVLALLLAAAPAGAVPAAAAAGAAAPELMVYAAVSLGEVLETLAPACEAEAGARLVFNLAGSNDLARQILAAGRADLFLSADEAWMDRVEQAGLVEPGTRRTLLSNRLAVVVRGDGPAPEWDGPRSLAAPAIRRIAIADPEAVPAGRYARAWLESAGAWEEVAARILPALDVRAALAAVESGAAEAGIVYRTDAARSSRVRILHEVPADRGPRITYVLAVLRGRPHGERARRAAACLAGPAAGAEFERFGFVVAAAAP